MRIYIIGNDGITLCGETTPELNAGEIAIGSSEDLHAAPLSGKRLLALWNALPGVEKRKKVGDREELIDRLWSAIEGLPEPKPQSEAKRPSKQDDVIVMLRRPEGATVDEVASATGWQRHTEEEARAHCCLGQRGTWPGLPHRQAGEPMKPLVHDASARQHSGEPSSVRPFSVQTAIGRTAITRTWPSLITNLPDWPIRRQPSCGAPGGAYITVDRLRASVAI